MKDARNSGFIYTTIMVVISFGFILIATLMLCFLSTKEKEYRELIKEYIAENKEIQQSCGLSAKAIEKVLGNDYEIRVEFEDGYICTTNGSIFEKGKVPHPLFNKVKNPLYFGFIPNIDSMISIDGEKYYEVECKYCGAKEPFTAEQMREHYKSHVNC